jgi:hypothetical protein
MTPAGRLGESLFNGFVRTVSDESLKQVIARVRAGDDYHHDDFLIMERLIEGEAEADEEALIEEYRAFEEEALKLITQLETRAKIEVLAHELFALGEAASLDIALIDVDESDGGS